MGYKANPIRVFGPITEMALPCGALTYVDTDMIGVVGCHSWVKRKDGYVATNLWNPAKKSAKVLLLHRLIMSAEKGQIVDHRSRNKLMNFRKNLRFCNPTQSSQNTGGKKTKKTPLGVSWCKRDRLFYVRMSINGKVTHIGCYKTENAAAEARKAAALKHFGTFAPEAS